MPKFNKTEDQLETMFDKWLFVLRNLSRLFERPKALQEKVFTKLFEQAEIARFSPEERRGYEDSVKAYRDINNAINTAKKDARQEEKVNTALKMKADGMSTELIAKYTSLSIDEIEKQGKKGGYSKNYKDPSQRGNQGINNIDDKTSNQNVNEYNNYQNFKKHKKGYTNYQGKNQNEEFDRQRTNSPQGFKKNKRKRKDIIKEEFMLENQQNNHPQMYNKQHKRK